jgi:hypothetical protein
VFVNAGVKVIVEVGFSVGFKVTVGIFVTVGTKPTGVAVGIRVEVGVKILLPVGVGIKVEVGTATLSVGQFVLYQIQDDPEQALSPGPVNNPDLQVFLSVHHPQPLLCVQSWQVVPKQDAVEAVGVGMSVVTLVGVERGEFVAVGIDVSVGRGMDVAVGALVAVGGLGEGQMLPAVLQGTSETAPGFSQPPPWDHFSIFTYFCTTDEVSQSFRISGFMRVPKSREVLQEGKLRH